jgi:photosystem II stability/assembly factor-like uncharacterized protein
MGASDARSEEFQSIGPWSGFVLALTYAPTGGAAYAGLNGLVYRTTNDGATWEPLSVDAFSLPYFVALTVGTANPNLVLAGSDYNGIYRSTDGGAGWVPSTGDPDEVTDLLATPFLSFATSPEGIFRSLDFGASFSPVSGLAARAIAYQPLSGNLFIVVGNGGGVFRSDLGGETWFPASIGLGAADLQTIAVHPDSASVLYVGGPSGLFKTTNQGQSWSPVPAFSFTWVFDIAIDPTNGARVHVASFDAGIFRSTNGGGTWEQENAGLGDLRARELAVKPGASGSLLCGTFARAVYGSTNGGQAWAERSTGISEFYAEAIAVHGAQQIWTGGSGIALTTNSGADWTFSDFQDPGFAISAIAPSPDDPSIVWAASRSGGISRSTNGGLHWTIAHDPPAGAIEDLVVDPTDARYVYALADWSSLSEAQVVRTTDGGTTWSAAPLAKVEFTNSIAIQPGAPSRLLAGTSEGLWESTDRGAAFHLFAPDLANYNIRDVVFSPSSPNRLWVIKGWEGVHRSTDGGLTFAPANGGLDNGVSELVVREIGGGRTLFAISGLSRLYQSTNDGDSWTPVTAGLELAGGVGKIAWQAMADRLLAGTPHGIYVLDFETTAVGSEASPAASSLRVTGPWPNPLVGEGAVVLELEAASPSPFTLGIYDATGRWVRGLAGRIDPGGTTVRWDGRNARGGPVASGTYLLRMSTQGQELIRKVQIVR